MSTGPVETPAAPAADLPPRDMTTGLDLGTLEEIRAELGTDQFPPEEGAAPAPAAEAKPAETAAPAVDDAQIVKDIMRRSRERRAARQAAAAPPTAAPVSTPAPTAQPAAAPTAPKSETALAVEDVLKQIARLAGDDAEAAAEPATTAGKAERNEVVEAIRAKLDELVSKMKPDSALTEKVTALEETLKGLNNAQIVREHISQTIDVMADKAPMVSSGKRFTVEINGKMVTGNGNKLVALAVERFFDRNGGAVPDVRVAIATIEKKLAGTPEKTIEKPGTRRTISQSLGSPPAARSGDDTRSAEDALRDFNADRKSVV